MIQRPAKKNVEYSICIAHYNNVLTLKGSLESILSQIDENFEVVIVDNKSTDGSERILQDYANRGMITLVKTRSSRGRARQIAFENSSGKYIVANMDMDDFFRPRLQELLRKYRSLCDGYLLWTNSTDSRGFWGGENFTIVSRNLISEIGGWRDLSIGEDWELASRAAKVGQYRWGVFKLLDSVNSHPERKRSLGRIKFRYASYRDRLRCGRILFSKNERTSLTQRIVALAARASLLFYKKYIDPFNLTFDPYAPQWALDLEKTSP